jgi:methionyl-tRNA formyltransferase
MTSAWRIVFFGTPSFAVPVLESLIGGPDEVVAVVTQPDRGSGRGQKLAFSPVKETALRHGLPLFQPEKVRPPAFMEEIRGYRPDVLVVAAFGQILPAALLSVPARGSINVHASLLPRYRGASPIVWAILRGETMTGVTTMLMDAGMDTGDILLQKETPIGPSDTGETLHDRLAVLGAGLLRETLEGLKTGTVRPRPQDGTAATYAPLLKKEDGRIDWGKGAVEIDRQVRAFTPWPGALACYEGKLLKVVRGEAREKAAGSGPGTVLWVGGDFIEVAAGQGVYLLREVQPEGKRKMAIRDFLQGHPISPGTVFK